MKHPLSDLDTVQSEFSVKRQCQERQELSVFRCGAAAQPIPNQFQTPFPNPFQNHQHQIQSLFQNPQLNELQNRQNQTQMQQNLLHNQFQNQQHLNQQTQSPAAATPPPQQQTVQQLQQSAEDEVSEMDTEDVQMVEEEPQRQYNFPALGLQTVTINNGRGRNSCCMYRMGHYM